MVSDEMAQAALDNISKDFMVDGDATAQAVIDAAWKPFDKDDESTWPKATKNYYVRAGSALTSCWIDEDKRRIFSAKHWELKSVTEYADPQNLRSGPQDLMPGDSK